MSNYIGSLPESAKDIQAQLPIGAIIAFSNAKLPLGWIECNGQATTAYPLLAAVAGATVPDLRGEFIRGFDNGKGTDPARVLGSAQADEFLSHKHAVWVDAGDGDKGLNNLAAIAFGNNTSDGANTGHTTRTGSDNENLIKTTGGTETRPLNIALIYIIKAFNIVNDGEVSGFITANKNYIINPTFLINQRAFAGGATTSSQVTYDRWKSVQAGNVSSVDASGFVTISGFATNGGLSQRLESFGTNTQVTLSWEGTSLGQYYRANAAAWSTPEASPMTITLEAGTLSDVKEYFNFGNGTLKNAKLELGSTPTPFEYPDKGSELTKCQRYFEKTYLASIAPGTISTAGSMYEPATRNAAVLSGGIFFKVTKRAVPVVTLYSNQTGASGVVNNVTDKAAVMNQISENGARYLTITGGVTTTSITYQWTADAEL